MLEIRSHVNHYVKYTFLCFESCCLQPFLFTPASLSIRFFWSLSCCSTTSTTCCSTTKIFWSSTTCLLPRPFYCLHGFSKVPCLFCQPGFFCFSVAGSMGFDAPISAVTNHKLVCKLFWYYLATSMGLWI